MVIVHVSQLVYCNCYLDLLTTGILLVVYVISFVLYLIIGKIVEVCIPYGILDDNFLSDICTLEFLIAYIQLAMYLPIYVCVNLEIHAI